MLDTVERFEPDAILVWNLAGLPLTILNALAAVDAPAVFVVADTWPAQAWTTDPWHRMVEGAPMLARLVSRMFGISAGLPALGVGLIWLYLIVFLVYPLVRVFYDAVTDEAGRLTLANFVEFARDEPGLIRQALERFEAMALAWHAEQTEVLLS